jgi:hypothetical protein
VRVKSLGKKKPADKRSAVAVFGVGRAVKNFRLNPINKINDYLNPFIYGSF